MVPRKGAKPSRKGNHSEGTPGRDTSGVKHHTQTPFLNIDTFTHWYRIKNIARVRVNRDSCMALLGSGAQINTFTPEFIETHSLDVGPLTDLMGR